jgi:hypothetical protein
MKNATLRIRSKGWFHNRHIEKSLKLLEKENKIWMWYKVDKKTSIPQPCYIDYIVSLRVENEYALNEISNEIFDNGHCIAIQPTLELKSEYEDESRL